MPFVNKSLMTIFGLSSLAFEQTQAGVSFGKCPSVSTMHDLDVSKYQGRWYEI